jgi:hypothetical protein
MRLQDMIRAALEAAQEALYEVEEVFYGPNDYEVAQHLGRALDELESALKVTR